MKKYVIAPVVTFIVGGIFEAVGYTISGSFGLGAVPAVIVMGTFILASLGKAEDTDGTGDEDLKETDKEARLLVDALEKKQK